jgi:hypothetical protein
MNHSEAIQSNAIERYLLKELVDPELDAFEEHYFGCRVCGDAVRDGEAMFVAGRAVVEPVSVPSPLPFPRRKPIPWIPASAAAALTLIAAQTAFIIRLMTATPAPPLMIALTSGPLLNGASRAADSPPQLLEFEKDRPLVAFVDIPAESDFSKYSIELRNASGKVLAATDVSVSQVNHLEGSPLPLLLRQLPAGRYVVASLGVRKDGNRPELAKTSVVVP